MVNDAVKSKIIESIGQAFRWEGLVVGGALLLMASAILGWLDRPIMGWLIGLHLPLSDKLPVWISYGLFGLTAGLISLLALVKRFRWVSVLAGGGAFVVSLHFLLSYSIINAKEVITINELNHQEERIIVFNKNNLPMTFMVNPTFDPGITTDTIKDRLYATIHYSTFGWYASMLGSILMLIAFCRSEVRGEAKGITYALFGCILILYVFVTISKAVSAEHHKNMGDYCLGMGMYHRAIEEYKHAINRDCNINYIRKIHNSIGKAYWFMQRADTADYYIYKGNSSMADNNYDLAIYYYQNAIITDISVAEAVGRGLLASSYVKYGLYQYDKKMVGSAIELWKKALATYNYQSEAYYYLCRAYYDLSAYDEAVMAGLQFMGLCENKIRNAEMSCNIGDSYYRMKRYDLARVFYLKSLKLVMNGNQRALMSLVGVER